MRLVYVCSYCNRQYQAIEPCRDCETKHLDGKNDGVYYHYKETTVEPIEVRNGRYVYRIEDAGKVLPPGI